MRRQRDGWDLETENSPNGILLFARSHYCQAGGIDVAACHGTESNTVSGRRNLDTYDLLMSTPSHAIISSNLTSSHFGVPSLGHKPFFPCRLATPMEPSVVCPGLFQHLFTPIFLGSSILYCTHQPSERLLLAFEHFSEALVKDGRKLINVQAKSRTQYTRHFFHKLNKPEALWHGIGLAVVPGKDSGICLA